jgi:uncharacterized protein YkwD
MTAKRHRRAVTTLVDDERRAAGLPALKYAGSLRISAQAWARAMVRNSRFGHGNFAKRILRFPFVLARRGQRWRVGENLATAKGTSTTPRTIVALWMSSADHRSNILGDYQYGAVWSSRDTPTPGAQKDGVTVVQHFGRTLK